MPKNKNKSNLSNVNNKLYGKKNSPEPNDGLFMEKDYGDTFSAEGTVRYGEETDVDDI